MPSASASNGTSPTSQVWEPESPFLSDVPPSAGLTTTAMAPSAVFAPEMQSYSPFVPEYQGEGSDAGPRAEQYASLMSELSDTEFSEALEDLVNEATAIAEDRLRVSSESGDAAMEHQDAEQAVRAYLEPIGRVATEMLEGMAEGLANTDLRDAGENEVDSFLEAYGVPAHNLSPVADQFLGGLLKKAKKIASKVTSVLPHAIIMKKLAKLVKPLLDRVLKSAINRLPASVRPIAQQLAKRFIGGALSGDPHPPGIPGPLHEEEDNEELASVDPVQLEEELDAELAGYVMDGEDYEDEAAVERAVADELSPRFGQLRHLAHARRRFAKRVVALKPDEPVEPVVEEFVPAILAALKLGISVIGRPKVVSTLSGFVANFIKKWVGEQQARQLSGALVDTGLKLFGLETADESAAAEETAGYALGATVEDTIARLVQDAPEAAWESEPLLHSYALEAFEQAASAHFPDALIRTGLHESAKSSGAWVGLPLASPHKSYKKYTRVMSVTLSPQSAAAVKTFGGVSLKAFLADRLGVNVDGPVQARAHLFEAIPGTSLGLISLGEKRVPLLGSAGRTGRSLLHPLTPEAATALFGEPGLGRPVGEQFLARRGRIAVGQRFYFLQVEGARVKHARRVASEVATTRPARSTQPRVILDFPKREVRIFLFFSESDAQQLAAQLRKKASPASVIALLKSLYESTLKRVLKSHPSSAVKVIHEAAVTENLSASMSSWIMRVVGPKLSKKVREWLATVMSRELTQNYEKVSADFVRAASDDADGVTLSVTFQAPPILEQIRKVLKGGWSALPGALRSFAKETIGSYRLDLRAGFAIK